MATYLHHAEIYLYRDRKQIGYGEYHLRGGGGLALTKFAPTKQKIEPVIDELFSKYDLIPDEKFYGKEYMELKKKEEMEKELLNMR